MSDSRPLRVCFPFVGDTIGGSHLSAFLLVEGLKELGVEPLIVLHQNGPLQAELERRALQWFWAPDVEVVGNCSIATQPVRMMLSGIRLAGFLRHHRIDIVHANDLRMNLTWVWAAGIAGAKFVWHHRSASSSPRLTMYSIYSHAFLTISEFCRSNLRGGLSRRAIVIDNPFDTSSAPPDREVAKRRLCADLGIGPESLLVGFVGNLYERKRPDIFLECAVKLYKSFGDRLAFPMFGELHMPLNQRLQERIRTLGLVNRVVALGARFPIEPWLAGCDVLVAPANGEPFGRTLVEAMLVGTPVVASDSGGHPEVLENGATGILVPADNVDAFVGAVASLLRDPPGARVMVAQAEQRARARFSVVRHASQMLSVYRTGKAEDVITKPKVSSAPTSH